MTYAVPHPLLGGSPLDSIAGEEGAEGEEPLNKRSSVVNFDIKVVPDSRPKATISRDPTPFPKELHSKAMQWRAARAAATGGGGADAEGGVTKRIHVGGKRIQNRNSLLTALANPLDVRE